MMRSAEKDRLRLEQGAALPVLEDAFDDVARLVGFVGYRHQLRPFGGSTLRPQVLGEALGREADDCVGRIEDRLRRAIVAGKRDDRRSRAELMREVEDVAHGRGAEGIDRLGIVADHREPGAIGLERQQDRRLQPVGVLILVHQDMIEAAGDLAGERVLAEHRRPIEEKVIVIEDVLALLGLDIELEQAPQLVVPAGAPGKAAREDPIQRGFLVDGARVDRQTRGLGGKPAFRLRQAELVAHQVHQVGRVFAIVDREGRVEADLAGIFA